MTLEEKLFYGEKTKTLKSLECQLLLLVEHIVTASYIWEGLPDEIEIDIPERSLFYFGQVLFFNVGEHYAMTQTVGNGTINIYGRFSSYRPILRGSTSFSQEFLVRPQFTENMMGITEPQAVLVRNNEQSLPTLTLVMPIIHRLSALWISMGMKQALSRVKCLIQANESSAKIIKQAISSIVESDDLFAVISDKRNKGKSVPMLSELQTLQVYGEYEPSKDWYDFDKTWSLLMTMLGVSSNAEQNKKERLIVDEANADEMVVNLVNDMPYRLRLDAVEKINKMFGLSISVVSKAEQQEEKDKADKQEQIEAMPEQPVAV